MKTEKTQTGHTASTVRVWNKNKNKLMDYLKKNDLLDNKNIFKKIDN
jgi:hypothetical protein